MRTELQRLEAASYRTSSDVKVAEARRRFLKSSLNRHRVLAMVDLAKAHIKVPLDRLDSDDDLLGVANGVLDLRTMRLIPDARDRHVTHQAGVCFEPDAACPLFKTFLDTTFGGNEALIRYATGILGYALSGRNRRQEFYVFCGEGANGKSTLMRVVLELMSGYARSLMPETLFEAGLGQSAHYDLALLAGVRLAVVQEAESRHRLHGPRIKQITGGDAITARQIYGKPFEFKPKAKIIIVTNKRPELDAYDKALERRMRIIPFDNVVPEAQRDPSLLEKLRGELPGIFNLLVEAGRAFESGAIVPDAVRKATRD